MKKEKIENIRLSSFGQQLFNVIGDAWILMLCLGALSKNVQLPINLSYSSCLLIVIISIALIPQNTYVKNILEEMYKNDQS
jgi:hypothetical protein